MDIFKLSKNKSGQEGRQFRIFLPHGGEASNTLRKKPTKEDKFNSYLQTYYTRGEEVPFCILIDRATIVALKQHEKTKKLVITIIDKVGEK